MTVSKFQQAKSIINSSIKLEPMDCLEEESTMANEPKSHITDILQSLTNIKSSLIKRESSESQRVTYLQNLLSSGSLDFQIQNGGLQQIYQHFKEIISSG
jgi:hypothetical protein